MVLVWMPVYNEAKSLERSIESVLSQTYTDFQLIVSENHSTDGSSEIIDQAAAKDSRVKKVAPPSHLSSMEHAKFINREVLDKAVGVEYSILIGGHDLWQRDLLTCLVKRSEMEPDSSIVYTDSYEIDSLGRILRQYCGWVLSKDIGRPYIPHHILLGLTHNIVIGGLWRESMRKKIHLRHSCVGSDHFVIAEMALHGHILYQPGSIVYLGQGTGASYIDKHIPEDLRESGLADFAKQLEWAAYLVDKATEGDAFCEQPLVRNMIKSSLLSAYICRYKGNLTNFKGGLEGFFNHPKVREIMGACTYVAKLYDSLQSDLNSGL